MPLRQGRLGGIGCCPRFVGQEHQKSLPLGGGQHVSRLVLLALSGLLPSPTQMAPYRELNKYEANNGREVGRQHGVTSCNPSRGIPAQPLWYAPASNAVNPELEASTMTEPGGKGQEDTRSSPTTTFATTKPWSSRAGELPQRPNSGEGSHHRNVPWSHALTDDPSAAKPLRTSVGTLQPR
jgi:hypothetical protein